MANIGHAGAVPGQVFGRREAIRFAGLHRHQQRGISGTADEAAEAIVLSGGYADDIDLGDEVIYPGEGRRDATTGLQTSDRRSLAANAALANSSVEGMPCACSGRPAPRTTTTVQRIVRSTFVAQGVKDIHQHRCQVCGDRIELAGGRVYAEAAHIRPLGLPHSGPDTDGNVLCLCPSDHVRFDYGALHVDATGNVVETASGAVLGPLRIAPGHTPDPQHLAYHRDQWTAP